MADIIQLRFDTTANWESVNPILAQAEKGIEQLADGSYKEKIGNGVTAWIDLPYYEALIGDHDHEIGDVSLVFENALV